tara:strand:+ start:12736 stop:14565 length:1830 start_codon:yes stop_codon:yes gene_type:complete
MPAASQRQQQGRTETPIQSVRIPVIRGLTDYPEHAEPGEAGVCFNVDLSEHRGRTRKGAAWHGNTTNYISNEVDPLIQQIPVGLWHFRSRQGVLYEIRAVSTIDGKGYLIAHYGLAGDAAHSFTLPTGNTKLDHLARWAGVEFSDKFIVAAPPNDDDDQRTLYSYDPNAGFKALEAVDRGVTPLHGSALFWGVDGDDEGPYLDQAPKGRILATLNGRLFVAGFQEERDALRYSNLLDANGWPGNNIIRIKTHDGAAITGLGGISNYLVIFKERSIHIASVNSQYDANTRRVVDGTGCVNHATIQNVGDSLMFLGEDGVYLFNGQQITYLSQKIEHRLRSFKHSFKMAISGYYRKRAQYWIAFPSGQYHQGRVCDIVFVYDLRRKEWSEYRFGTDTSIEEPAIDGVAQIGFGAFSSVLVESGSEHFVAGVLNGPEVEMGQGLEKDQQPFYLNANYCRYMRLDAQENDDIIDPVDGLIETPVESAWESAPLVLGEHICRRFDSLRPVFAGNHNDTMRIWWRMDAESRDDAVRYDQQIDVEGGGEYQPKSASRFDGVDWFDASLWSDIDPYSDKLRLHGAQGRTIRIGIETKHKHGFDVRSLLLDTRPLSRW